MRTMTYGLGFLLLISLLTAIPAAEATSKRSVDRDLDDQEHRIQAYCLHTLARPLTVCELSIHGADAEEIHGFILDELPCAEVLYTTASERNRSLVFAGSSGVLVFDGVVRVHDVATYTVLMSERSIAIAGPGFDTTSDLFGRGSIA
jgi:hypothetical protein